MSENVDKVMDSDGIYAPFHADEESPYIFISYDHDDHKRVFPIITKLYEKGWKIWYDVEIPLGEDYYACLYRHIRDCTVFLLFVTENSVNSEFVCEKELVNAVEDGKIIIQCILDENAEFTGEAHDIITFNTRSKKHRKTDEAGLEATLETIKGLTKGKPRIAEGFSVSKRDGIVTDDGGEYRFEKCNDGVRLTRYLGSDTDVIVPAEYPIGSGQKVVELRRTFVSNELVRTVRLPSSVKLIGDQTFGNCSNLSDVYIPSSVMSISALNFDLIIFGAFNGTNCIIHCAKGSAAHKYAIDNNISYQIDESLALFDAHERPTSQTAYAYISYSPDMRERATEIIIALEKYDCILIDGGGLSGRSISEAIRKSACFIALAGKSYLEDKGEEIEDYWTAKAHDKERFIYILEECELPAELKLHEPSQQQIRYDSLTEEERIAKMVNWLQKRGCRRSAVDIPGFEYTATKKEGITLTKYTGDAGNLVIEREYDGTPVTKIGYQAFKNCIGLKDITIPDNVTNIDNSAFSGCTGLTKVIVPDSVTRVGDNVFRGCTSLTSINIPDSVTKIGKCAFLGCIRLDDITIPDSVSWIGGAAFYGCANLTSINIPDSVTYIIERTFSRCTAMNDIAIPDSVAEIGDRAFSGCTRLTSITIPDSVTKIGYGAFTACPNLTVYCSKDSHAWRYCEENNIKHKPLSAKPTPRKKSPTRWLIPFIIALLVLAGGAAIQFTGLYDLLGLLGL